MRLNHLAGSLLATSLLTACGGGDGGHSSDSTSPTQPAPDLSAAIASGRVSALPADATPEHLLQAAARLASAQKAAQPDLRAIVPDLPEMRFTNNSVALQITDPATTVPVSITRDNDIVVAAAQIGTGRAVSYGTPLNQLVGSQSAGAHFTLWKALTAWSLTGDKQRFPATLTYATSRGGWDQYTLPLMLANAGAAATRIECEIDIDNSCWQQADLLVFWQDANDDETAEAMARTYLAAGKAVMYMGVNYAGFNAAVNRAMNLAYRHHLYWADVSMPPRTASQVAALADDYQGMTARIQLLAQLQQENLTRPASWDSLIGTVDKLAAEYQPGQSAGLNLFDQSSAYDLHKHLVLWADLYRRDQSVYDDSVGYDRGLPVAFLRQMAADTWTHAVRDSAPAPSGFGEWMNADVQSLPVTPDAETLTVTLPNQTDGATLIGRLAVPGRPVTVEIVDDGGTRELGLRTGFIRRYMNPLPDDRPGSEHYLAPRLPGGHASLLLAGRANTRTYAMGGPLFLTFSGNPQGNRVVTLKITGGARYGHWDYTQTTSEAERQAALDALQAGKDGWQTIKLVAGELQTAPSRVGNVSSGEEVDAYVTRIRDWVFGFNHKVHGYSNVALSEQQAALCSAFDWDCLSPTIHAAPGVQHFVSWYAQCGYACSGNPSDISGRTDAGWATFHELGHNTVTAMESMYNCSTECDNNIAAGMSAIGSYVRSAGQEDIAPHNFHHEALYGQLLAAQATGLQGDALRQASYRLIWEEGHDGMRQGVTAQIAFLYTRLRLGLAYPTADGIMEFMGLLNKGWRLRDQAWDDANKDKYAMGAYASKDEISKEDGFYVLASKIIGQDLRDQLAQYGFTLDQRALDSVGRLGLPRATPQFYALAVARGNQLDTGVWLDTSGTLPPFPAFSAR